MRDLGPLGSIDSDANGINDTGQVVGSFITETPINDSHAFITGPDGMDMRDLTPMGPPLTNANGINDSGQVVGSFYTAGGRYDGRDPHAFITGPNGAGVTDLNSLVHPPGVIFTDAIGINKTGKWWQWESSRNRKSLRSFLRAWASVGFIARRKKMNAGGFSLG